MMNSGSIIIYVWNEEILYYKHCVFWTLEKKWKKVLDTDCTQLSELSVEAE